MWPAGGTTPTGKLTITSTPDKKLVFTNEVYVAPAESLTAGAEYVVVNKTVFLCKGHAEIKVGEIGLSAPQRTSAKVNVGEVASVAVWRADASFNLIGLRLELDIVGQARRRIEVKEDDLTQYLKQKFVSQPFTVGQEFAIQFEGNPLQLVVKSCSLAEKDKKKELTRFAPVGILRDSTEVEIEADKKHKFLAFTKSASSRSSALFRPDWKFEDMGIGGLDNEFSAIFRRAFASRLFPPAIIMQLGIKHVKGMLLYGPPGTGKTLIARQIGKMLAQKEPKVVNGPEILNKYVGQSEENIRKLFEEAEKDFKENKEHAELHIIIFDEIDAICKARGSRNSGTDVHDTVVNQLLSKIDGVDSLDNILVIGMTNRKDMLDPALLRPGRLEVHIEIGLPDEDGRHSIFGIHTRKMRENNRLAPDVDLRKLAALSKNFSGAEIEGLVKAASSFALYGSIDVTKESVTAKKELGAVMITMADFMRGLEEITPAFGVSEDALQNLVRGRLYEHGPEYKQLMNTARTMIEQVRTSEHTPLLSVLLQGPAGCGKTAIAASLGLESKFPFVKLISPEMFLGVSEAGKSYEIAKIFEDSYKSPLSLVVIDDIERLLEYVPIGPRFSNSVLQTLLVTTKRIPPTEGRKLMILATTSSPEILTDMQLKSCFNAILKVPELKKPEQIAKVLTDMSSEVKVEQIDTLAKACPFPISIKQFLIVTEMARQGGGPITAAKFQECIREAGLHRTSSSSSRTRLDED